MELSELMANLPPWLAVVFVACLAVAWAVIKFGYTQGGREADAGGRSQAQVAAVIVDPSALNNLSNQVAALAAALDRIIRTGESLAESEDAMAEELSRVREEIRITREVNRR